MDQGALKRYCRVIVGTERGVKGDYPKLGEALVVGEEELQEFDRALKEQMRQEAAGLSRKGMKMAVLTWQPMKVVRLNGFDAIMVSYSRSVNDGPGVLVRLYTVPNNDCLHTVDISYRESEKALWAKDLESVIGTFEFRER